MAADMAVVARPSYSVAGRGAAASESLLLGFKIALAGLLGPGTRTKRPLTLLRGAHTRSRVADGSIWLADQLEAAASPELEIGTLPPVRC